MLLLLGVILLYRHGGLVGCRGNAVVLDGHLLLLLQGQPLHRYINDGDQGGLGVVACGASALPIPCAE
jgi:hypothetical protein